MKQFEQLRDCAGYIIHITAKFLKADITGLSPQKEAQRRAGG